MRIKVINELINAISYRELHGKALGAVISIIRAEEIGKLQLRFSANMISIRVSPLEQALGGF